MRSSQILGEELSLGKLEGLQKLPRKLSFANKNAIGTFTLAALLVFVYQIEIVLTGQFGYQSPQALFDAVPSGLKPVLTAILGPFLHQSASLVLGNLGILLLAGAYIEYFHGERSLYSFYFLAGYTAAWVPLFFGSVGAVGASGVTYGLQAWMAVHATSRIISMLSDGDTIIDRRFGHIVPLGFGAGSTVAVTMLVFGGNIGGAGDVTHFIGAMVGLIWGGFQVLRPVDRQFSNILRTE